MTGQPFMCPDCGCPLQRLCSKEDGETPIGTLNDALEAHRVLVHPSQPEVTA